MFWLALNMDGSLGSGNTDSFLGGHLSLLGFSCTYVITQKV